MSATSRRYAKLSEAQNIRDAVKAIVAKNYGIRGVVDVLEILYEHCGQQNDSAGLKIVDALIDYIEDNNNFVGAKALVTQVNPQQNSLQTSLPQTQGLRVIPQNPWEKSGKGSSSARRNNESRVSERTNIPAAQESLPKPNKNDKTQKTSAQLFEKKRVETKIIAESDEDSSKSKSRGHRSQTKTPPADDDFGNFDVQVMTTEELQNMKMPEEITKYLSLQDITPGYRYVYVNHFDKEQIEEIRLELEKSEYIGVDCEFHLKAAKCSYVQLSTPTFGVIFNIRPLDLRNHPVFKLYLRELLESEKVKKLGHSLLQDLKVIRRAFFGDLDFKGLISLEEYLFTCKTNVLSLSGICRRLFGLPLNKDYQAWIGEQEDLDSLEEQEYAVMDALAPLVVFQRLKPYCLAKIPKGTFMVNCGQSESIDKSEFLLDHHMELIRVFLDRFDLKYSVLKDKTYDGR